MSDNIDEIRALAQKDQEAATKAMQEKLGVVLPLTPPAAPDWAAQPLSRQEADYLDELDKQKTRLRAQRDAKKQLEAEEFEQDFSPPTLYTSAAEGFAVDRPPLQFGLDKLVVKGGNVLITSGFKTGKTDLCWNIVRAYADNVPFLGEYDVLPMDTDRKVVMLDFELDEDYAWTIFAKQQVKRPDRANLINFRGKSFSLSSERHRAWLTETLIGMGCQVLIVDPFGAAYTGEENSNSEVREWLRHLDHIKIEAGIREVYLTTHTGRAQAEEGQERARGATRLNDWADSLWSYNRDEQPGTTTPAHHRFLRAFGRGVDLPETAVEWASDTHQITLVDGGGNRAASRRNTLQAAILAWIKDYPNCSTKQIKDNVRGKASYIDTALDQLSEGDTPMLIVTPGPNRAKNWALSDHGKWMMDRGTKVNT